MFVLRNTIEPPTARRKTLRYYKSRLTCLLLLGWISQVSANQIPTATALLITTKEDSKTSVILKGTDPEKKKLTYAIVSQPQYGTVTLAGGKATYLPAANYFNTTSSPDSFTFKVNDGTQNSTPATISVVVTAVNDPPVAQNSIASVIQNTATDITLSASDVDGDILTYLPTKKTKKGGTVIWKTGNIVTYTPKLGYVGSDSFTFTVQDNKKGKSKTATVSITVTAKPQNLPPIANAGADQNINEQTLVTLDGSASKDTDGSIDSYAWKQTAGTTVTLASTTSAKPTFTAPDVVKDEILTFELTVTDNSGMTAKDLINIHVLNIEKSLLTVNAGNDTSVNERVMAYLSGSAVDKNGNIPWIESYNWKQTDNLSKVKLQGENTSQAMFIAPNVDVDTTFKFTFTAQDWQGNLATDSVSILVKKKAIQNNSKINDTGITGCSNSYAYNIVPSLDCSALYDSGGNIIPLGQDGHYGRDVTHNNNSDGHAGFSFTKISSSGTILPASATEWACVKDNVTNLTWEVKQGSSNDVIGDTGLHDPDDRFSWYEPDVRKNGGGEGYEDILNSHTTNLDCYGYIENHSNSYCNTNAYAQRVNSQSWCGINNWRLPTRQELNSIADYGYYNPAIDTDYFPDIVYKNSVFWTSTNAGAYQAFIIRFFSYTDGGQEKNNVLSVRLVSE